MPTNFNAPGSNFVPLGMFPSEDAAALAMLEGMGIDAKALRAKALRANGGGKPAPIPRDVPMSQPTVSFEQSAAPRQVAAGSAPAQSQTRAASPTSPYDAILEKLYPQESEAMSRERAAKLRHQRALGYLGVLSGDEPIGQLGAQMLGESQQEEERGLARDESRRGAQLRFTLEELADKRRVGERQEAKAERDLARDLASEDRRAARGESRDRWTVEQEGQRGRDFRKTVDDFVGSRQDAQTALNIAQGRDRLNAQEQFALTQAFQKMLDKGAVVRESDIQMIQRLRPLSGEIDAIRNRIESGAELTPDQVQKMREVARQYLAGAQGAINRMAEQEAELGRRQGFDPSNYIPKEYMGGGAKGAASAPRIVDAPPPGATIIDASQVGR